MFSNTSFAIDKVVKQLNLSCDIDDLKYVLINFNFKKLLHFASFRDLHFASSAFCFFLRFASSILLARLGCLKWNTVEL